MVTVTVVTPVAPHHDALLGRAAASVAAQTVACNHVVYRDDEQRGAGYARNRALELVQTPLVVFLDADDQLAPTFVERCLSAFDGSVYVYTDWTADGKVQHAPDCAWHPDRWHREPCHCITALVPTAWVREVGGFDEQLQAAEDSDLWLRITAAGHCGKRLSEPLFVYGKEGKRSRSMIDSGYKDKFLEYLKAKHGGRRMADCGGCGGGNINLPENPLNQQLPGMALARSQWMGNRSERGHVSGMMYPRTGNGSLIYVYEQDIAAAPHHWQRAEAPQMPNMPVLPTLPPSFAASLVPDAVTPLTTDGEMADIAEVLGLAEVHRPMQQALPPQPDITPAKANKPDVGKITQKANRRRMR